MATIKSVADDLRAAADQLSEIAKQMDDAAVKRGQVADDHPSMMLLGVHDTTISSALRNVSIMATNLRGFLSAASMTLTQQHEFLDQALTQQAEAGPEA